MSRDSARWVALAPLTFVFEDVVYDLKISEMLRTVCAG